MKYRFMQAEEDRKELVGRIEVDEISTWEGLK